MSTRHSAPAYSLEAAKKVPGIRPSLANSLDAKRGSLTVIDVLTAEDNEAESPHRVSGVSISREFGEGERVSIRSADGFVRDQLAATRSFNYPMLLI